MKKLLFLFISLQISPIWYCQAQKNSSDQCATLSGVKSNIIDNVLVNEDNINLKPGIHSMNFTIEGYGSKILNETLGKNKGLLHFTIECGKKYDVKNYVSNYVDSLRICKFGEVLPQIVEVGSQTKVSTIDWPKEFNATDASEAKHLYYSDKELNSNELCHFDIQYNLPLEEKITDIEIKGNTNDNYYIDYKSDFYGKKSFSENSSFFLKPGIYKIEYTKSKNEYGMISVAKYFWFILANANYSGSIDVGKNIIIPDIKSAFSLELNKIFFDKNENSLWIVGGCGKIKSMDRGETWEKKKLPNKNTAELSDIFFTDSVTGWAIGNGNIFKTMDGGDNWNIIKVSKEDFRKIYFYNKSEGFLYKAFDSRTQSYLSYTNDGGSTWTVIDKGGLGISDIYGAVGYAFWGKTILKTTIQGAFAVPKATLISNDLCKSWQPLFDKAIINFISTDSLNAWVILYNDPGKIYHSADKGKSWTEQQMSDTPLKMFFIDNKNGWAICSHYRIYITKDGGNNWTFYSQMDILAGIIFNDIYFITNDIGFLISNNGYIYRTTDSGKSWSRVNILELF